MGSNGFSSERKQKCVDLLKQLLDTNTSTQGSSNPLEAVLSGLDLGSLEGLMQKNKKSHHDDWDSKKKRHHDDCSDHDWDHKKKHHHDDCGCEEKKHHHDDCGCKEKKHDHDDCGCKKKKRCKCCPDVTQEFRQAINEICRLLNAGITSTNLGALKDALAVLEDLLTENEDCVDKRIAEDLLELIDIIEDADTVSDIPLGTLDELGRQLNKLRRCLGLRVRVCRPGGGGGGDCTDCGADFNDIRNAINRVCAELRRFPNQFNLEDLQDDLEDLLPFLDLECISDSVRNQVTDAATPILDAESLEDLDPDALTDLSESLIALRVCIGVNNPDAPPCVPRVTPPGGGSGGAPIPSPITTIRQRLLDLLADQVVITTPTGLYAGTLVAVQVDYIAVVAPTGTYLIPIDQIQTFTTE
ncbi:hypothetical protein BMG_5755 (plasmid) [Priestia megaterium]|uniref:DUF2642 domain-containing protein n=1 Tax=Priestia megaterium TaxID=1404 RepID=UPI0015DD2B46|nr:DUF2642 domain-containing protein [Priestia megaterium]QLK09007.1 hypothetical protein BMG_5755 [Priestia megaterium]